MQKNVEKMYPKNNKENDAFQGNNNIKNKK